MTKATRNLMAAVAVAARVFVPDFAAAADHPQTRISVQVADYSQLPPAVVAHAQTEVAAIYGRIGVQVVWAEADGAQDSGRNFTVVILSREMGLRKIAADRVGENVMGQASKLTGRAYIFTHRVRQASARNCTDFNKLLGKVIAHEVGHLLLTNGHSEFGIMRPGIQVRTDASEWFTEAQGATIRAELAAAAN